MIEGHCLCGAVKVRVDQADHRVGACHCRLCQRWSGGLFLSFRVGELEIVGSVTRFQSSPFAERAFCPTCGSHIFVRDTAEGSPFDLMPGLFDEATTWPMRSEIYTDRALASVKLAGDHRRVTRAEYEAKNLHIEGDAP